MKVILPFYSESLLIGKRFEGMTLQPNNRPKSHSLQEVGLEMGDRS